MNFESVCAKKDGLCNIFGGFNCSTCGSVCKLGYEGDQCHSCQRGFYVSNNMVNGQVDPTTGEGPQCQGTYEFHERNELILIFDFISVCYNQDNQVCNRYGTNQNCGKNIACGPCMKGYKGDNCGECIPGYFISSGTNGKVNSITGYGVLCKGTLVQ